MMGAAGEGHSQQSLPEDAQLANAILGGGLPREAEEHLWEAAHAYQKDEVAEVHLRKAKALAPGHAAVLIGFYRFYFYKGRLAECLDIAKLCLAKAARDNRIPADWRDVKPGDAPFDRYEEILPRFFLFTLKGYAYLHMRLGNLEEGRAAIMKLLELDPSDKVGARVLLGVLERIGRDDYE
jgi:tetratricopeptide (TPR) repeat protein